MFCQSAYRMVVITTFFNRNDIKVALETVTTLTTELVFTQLTRYHLKFLIGISRTSTHKFFVDFPTKRLKMPSIDHVTIPLRQKRLLNASREHHDAPNAKSAEILLLHCFINTHSFWTDRRCTALDGCSLVKALPFGL